MNITHTDNYKFIEGWVLLNQFVLTNTNSILLKITNKQNLTATETNLFNGLLGQLISLFQDSQATQAQIASLFTEFTT